MKQHGIRLARWSVALGAALGAVAPAVADEALPAVQQAGAVTFLSGGIGTDQALAIKHAMPQYSLALTFVGTTRHGNEYLSDVPVTIVNSRGDTVLDTSTDGPFMLASLPAGRYKVDASYNGRTQRRVVNISKSTHARQMFSWPM